MSYKPKENSWILSVDQASNLAGASLWHNGVLIDTELLQSKKNTDPIATRLVTQVTQLTSWLDGILPEGEYIKDVVFEGVRSRIVLITVGAFLTCPHLRYCKVHPKRNFVESLLWKYYAKARGAEGPAKDIKGVKALREIGFPVDEHRILSDDIADSLLIYLTWRDRK